MATTTTEGVAAGRLAPEDYARNFADLTPPLTRHEAFVEAERCYFCYDAPCVQACPTSIDIPLFIRQIAKANDLGAAETILSANILGGMCARVCPTEELCEEACVREAEGKPVRIGSLQRPRHRRHDEDWPPALHTGARDRQAHRGRRRRPGRPVLRASPRHAGTCGDAVRCASQARRPQRIRHRGLQDPRRFCPERGEFHPVDRRHRGEARHAARGGHRPRHAAPGL